MTIWFWDPAKEAVNVRKHKLSLAEGIPVLDNDPNARTVPDTHPDGDRFRTLGIGGDGRTVLFVICTEPVEDIGVDGEWIGKIISVRKSTKAEEREYERYRTHRADL